MFLHDPYLRSLQYIFLCELLKTLKVFCVYLENRKVRIRACDAVPLSDLNMVIGNCYRFHRQQCSTKLKRTAIFRTLSSIKSAAHIDYS